MRWLALVFLAGIAALQYPMWLGKGGWLQVRALDREVAEQRATNAALKARNDSLDAEVRDLKTGFDAIEERARSGLGMVRQDEIFFEFRQDAAALPAPGRGNAVTDRSDTGPNPSPLPAQSADRR